MTTWTPEELAHLTESRSLVLSVGDGGNPGVELGMVLVAGRLYVRAYRGPRSQWYRAAHEQGHGQIRVGAVTRDVFLHARASAPASEIDAAYREKYGQAADALVASPAARAATTWIDPVP
ncbi:DUF2255 family protein [Kitasatospora cineracea]|uniref:DUF2255 family protein n=1 Tax=Kitasatospora cineracea TaxID=88074 RepID=UPI0033D2D84C